MSVVNIDAGADSMPLEHLEAQITELAGHLAAGECRWLLLIAEYDRRLGYEQWGCHNIVQWLGWHCGLEQRAARDRVRVAHALEMLPLVRERFSTGALSYSKVRALTRVATPENETDLVMLAEHSTASQIERIASSYRRVCSYEEETESSNEVHASRFVRLDCCDDGTFVLSGRLSPEQAAIVASALEQAKKSDEAGDKGGSAEPSTTTNADALVMMAESFLANGAAARNGGDRHSIVCNVDLEVLASDEDGTCELEVGSLLAPESARRLSCDASVVHMATDRSGEPLQVGKRTRTVPSATRRALKHRDQGCRFPGCSSKKFIDVHHIKHWAHGGGHEMANLVQLCWHHHRLVHEGGWKIQANEQGAHSATRPDGEQLRLREPVPSHSGAIKQINQSQGTLIDSDTCIPHCYGDPLNLDLILTALWRVDHPNDLN